MEFVNFSTPPPCSRSYREAEMNLRWVDVAGLIRGECRDTRESSSSFARPKHGQHEVVVFGLNRTGFDGDSQLVSSISEVSLMVTS
jgi:hypothetical protein